MHTLLHCIWHVYRLEQQGSKHNDYENTRSPTSIKLSQLDESKEPTYDFIDTTTGSKDVNMTPNPAYGTSSVKMDKNPAYK